MKKVYFLLFGILIIAGSFVLYGNSNKSSDADNENAGTQKDASNSIIGAWKGVNTPQYLNFSEDRTFSNGTDNKNLNFTNIPYRTDGSLLILTFGYGEDLQTYSIDDDKLTLSFITEPERPDEVYVRVE